MEWIFIIIGAVFVVGVALALYELKVKRTLLAHDLSVQKPSDPHTHAAKVQAEDATWHRISGFDR